MAADGVQLMHDDHVKMHGSLGSLDWSPPLCVTEFDACARLSFTDIKAHEFRDQDDVLQAKVVMLAGLVRRSRACVAFTGAGISTAAGIDDYATKGRDVSVTAEGRPRVHDWKKARPTRGHRVLVAMYEAGLLKHWVQQNHDSLPQKAGYPQHALNEIHGSLHDPSNPIVPYEGFLRDDLFAWLGQWERKNDLCLALGTSLSGFNVDSFPETAAKRYLMGDSLGLVIVNLQQTSHDAACALRIFATIDSVMELLAQELALGDRVLPMDHVHVPQLCDGALVEDDVFMVPFDAEGNASQEKSVWDLRLGRRVKLTGGPYCSDIGTIVEKSAEGHYRIRVEDSINPLLNMKRRPFSLWLGNWWLEEATKGYGICPGSGIPFVNVPDVQETQEEQIPSQPKPVGPARKPISAFQPPPLPPKRTPNPPVASQV